ncbi:hypothetical protein [Microbulbifer sp. PSTR4-B]|uniref:hypothetical protein n=1 Tax=Microbulbifer sp. PSTR4-B TaxID=3243396 RepID=UPI00403922FD
MDTTISCKRCGNVIQERPVPAWCDQCHYPGIEDEYREMRALIEEGYSYADAAVRSGYVGAEHFCGDD